MEADNGERSGQILLESARCHYGRGPEQRPWTSHLGQAPNRLPIKISAHIHHANALEVDWKEILPQEQRTSLQIRRRLPIPIKGQTFIFGNPPFIGHITRNQKQTEELREAWGAKTIGHLDYVTAWHAKTLDLFGTSNREGEWAFVTTNSIVQGQPVAALFGPIFDKKWKIKFAHRTFDWSSEATGKAAVHCVIVGFTRERNNRPRLFEYPDVKAEAQEIAVMDQINAYLVDGPHTLVTGRRAVLSPMLPKASFGNMPRDGGGLIVEAHEIEEVSDDPIAAKYVRPFVGSRELLRGESRWCLWLVDLDPADVTKSPLLRSRLAAVRDMRLKSKKAGTRELAATPHLFAEIRQPQEPYLCVPSVVSESRSYFTAARFTEDVIASNLAFQVEDPDGLAFALISSSMFITWQRTVGGQLESRLRFSSTVVWNNFPVPELEPSTREAIIKGGQRVLEARALNPERSLADHYNPLSMDPALLKAHAALDRVVDRAFGSKANPTEAERQATLFERYAEMTKSS